jgi:hypothetical protein
MCVPSRIVRGFMFGCMIESGAAHLVIWLTKTKKGHKSA